MGTTKGHEGGTKGHKGEYKSFVSLRENPLCAFVVKK